MIWFLSAFKDSRAGQRHPLHHELNLKKCVFLTPHEKTEFYLPGHLVLEL